MPENKKNRLSKDMQKVDEISERLCEKYNIKKDDISEERAAQIQERLMMKYNITEDSQNRNVDEIIVKVYASIAQRRLLMKDWKIE